MPGSGFDAPRRPTTPKRVFVLICHQQRRENSHLYAKLTEMIRDRQVSFRN
jgi:cobalamin biosynthesis Co2+ chelatase CbiK